MRRKEIKDIMGWNGSGGGSTPIKPKVTAKKPSPIRGIVAGALVCVLAIGAYFVFFSGSEKAQKEEVKKQPARIKEVKPAAAPKAEPVKELTDAEKRQKEIERYEKIFEGKEMPKGIKARIYYLKHPPESSYEVKVPHEYLRHHSERSIASIVLAEPGTEFLDVLQFGSSFNEDFVNALVDKIEIKEDDDEETRRVKEDVTAAKKEIARICREEAKAPNEVMNEYAKMMYDLGKFNRNLIQQLHEVRFNPDMSDEDVKDFFRAANKMREERGMAPIKVPSLAYRALSLSRMSERQAAKKAAAELSAAADEAK